MTTYRLNIVLSGIDFDDDSTFEGLAELPHVVWRAQGSQAYATAVVSAPSAVDAAKLVTWQVLQVVPGAKPLRFDRDLVAIPDIASRIGVTREAVRNWANGTRHANFPLPNGIVGDGIKVWAWSDVNRWLRQNLSLGDPEEFPSESDAVAIDAFFAQVQRRRAVAATATASWSTSEPVRASTRTRSVAPSGRSTPWTTSDRTTGVGVGAEKVHAAA